MHKFRALAVFNEVSVKNEYKLGLGIGNVVAEQIHKLLARLFKTEQGGALQALVSVYKIISVNDHHVLLWAQWSTIDLAVIVTLIMTIIEPKAITGSGSCRSQGQGYI